MTPGELEALEIELLLEAIQRRWGYDFRDYARASITRRVQAFLASRVVDKPSDLIPAVLHDAQLFGELAQHFSIAVTAMFRDPFVYRALREQVVPVLRSYPFVKVWHAGCATGEELYSTAIVLHEAGLLDRATLFGTDFNDDALARAQRGVYPGERIQSFTRNYQQAGGSGSFSEYYRSGHDSAVIDPRLRKRATFANHNLTTDQVFGEMHLVMCRNVLIYFNRSLQDHVLRLFTDSLVRGGFLCLGTGEDLQFSAVFDAYEVVDHKARIYRKRREL
jgi:chemotaxis protein methyltransferase CheR